MCNTIHVCPDDRPEPRRRIETRPLGKLAWYGPGSFAVRVPVTKPAAVFLWAWAIAQQHDDTLAAFAARHPETFPRLASGAAR